MTIILKEVEGAGRGGNNYAVSVLFSPLSVLVYLVCVLRGVATAVAVYFFSALGAKFSPI